MGPHLVRRDTGAEVLQLLKAMQNELGQAASIAESGVFYAHDVTQVSMIDVRDVAAAAARVLTGEGHQDRAYTLTGPQALGYDELATIYSEVLDLDIRWDAVSVEDARASMLEAGLPDGLAIGNSEIMERYRRRGITGRVTPDAERLLCRAPTSFEQFVRNNQDAYFAPALP